MNNSNPLREYELNLTRRQLFGRTALGLGTAAMANLLGPDLLAEGTAERTGLHHAAKAKRVIYLFMSGGPSHHDLWDYKPKMKEMFGEQLPDHIRDGQRITGMTAGQGNGEDMTGGILLMKADSDGNVVWRKAVGEPRQDSGSSVQQTSDGGYVIVGGAVESLESGPDGFDMDALILKTDSGGNEMWRITTGGAGDQRGSCVRQTTDGGYIITGYSEEIHIADRKEDSTIDGGGLLIKVGGEAGQAIGSDVEGSSGFAYEWVGLGAGMAVLAPGAALMLMRRRKKSITTSRNG